MITSRLNKKDYVFFLVIIVTITLISIAPIANGQTEPVSQHVISSAKPTLTDPNLTAVVIAKGFKYPTNFEFFDNEEILILEKETGKVIRVQNDSIVGEPAIDLNVGSQAERGLLGIAINRTAESKSVYLYLTQGFDRDLEDVREGMQPLCNCIYKLDYIDGKLLNPQLLLSLPALPGPSHNGGAIRIGPDGYIYVPVGDISASSSTNTVTQAQNNKTGFPPDGRSGILRLAHDGKPAGIFGNNDREDSRNATMLEYYYAYGIRNSFGIDFDPLTGKLWDTENGPTFGDEINLVESGFNSGWHKVQGIWRYINDTAIGEETSVPEDLSMLGGKGSYSKPAFIWNHTVAPTAIKFLNSEKLGDAYLNAILVGDYINGNIYHFDMNENRTGLSLPGLLRDGIANTTSELDPVIFGKAFGNIVDIEISPDGYPYVLARVGLNDGILYKIMPMHNGSKEFVIANNPNGYVDVQKGDLLLYNGTDVRLAMQVGMNNIYEGEAMRTQNIGFDFINDLNMPNDLAYYPSDDQNFIFGYANHNANTTATKIGNRVIVQQGETVLYNNTDDTLAIETGLGSLDHDQLLYIYNGTYDISSPLEINDNTYVGGQGSDTVLNFSQIGTSDAILMNNGSRLENLHVVGSLDPLPNGLTQKVVISNNTKIDRIAISRMGFGLFANNSVNSTISNLSCTAIVSVKDEGACIQVGKGSSNILVDNFEVSRSSNGIRVESGSSNIVLKDGRISDVSKYSEGGNEVFSIGVLTRDNEGNINNITFSNVLIEDSEGPAVKIRSGSKEYYLSDLPQKIEFHNLTIINPLSTWQLNGDGILIENTKILNNTSDNIISLLKNTRNVLIRDSYANAFEFLFLLNAIEHTGIKNITFSDSVIVSGGRYSSPLFDFKNVSHVVITENNILNIPKNRPVMSGTVEGLKACDNSILYSDSLPMTWPSKCDSGA